MTNALIYLFGLLYLTTSLFDGVVYNRIESNQNDRPLVVHKVEIDMTNDNIRLEHGFSFGVLYGFEKTSEIAVREKALLSFNGMFYSDLGLPLGLMIKDGQPVRSYDIGTPTFVLSNNREMSFESLAITGKVSNGSEEVKLYGINSNVPDQTWVLFDDLYGSTTRVRRRSINYRISDDTITDVVVTDQPVKLSTSDYVLTYVGDAQVFSVGDNVSINFDYGVDIEIEEAFQTGGWLVKDGVNVAKDYEPFIGYTTAPQPRTLIGIKDKDQLIIVVVDGRRTDYSIGMTGKASAELMLAYGCESAAYLDGGASSTLVIGNRVVNKPSGKEERAIAHSLNIFVDK